MRNCLQNLGYTLIEILVVLVIISIVTSFALLSIGNSRHRQLKNLASDLQQTISLAQEYAMLQPAVLAVEQSDKSILLLEQIQDKEKDKAGWQSLQDVSGLTVLEIPDGISVKIKVANSEKARIIISSNGELTPFSIYLGEEGDKPNYTITGSADGGLNVEEI